MKKLLLIVSIFSMNGVFAATINLINKTNAPIVAGIAYGTEKKESTIAPGKSDKFNSWLKGIDVITWKDASDVWNAKVNVKALDTEGSAIIYPNGTYDFKRCLMCNGVKGLKAERSSTSSKETSKPKPVPTKYIEPSGTPSKKTSKPKPGRTERSGTPSKETSKPTPGRIEYIERDLDEWWP